MRILLFIEYYLPGYKSGGPVRTINNIVESLGDEIDFLIICRDRDFGDLIPYPDIQTDAWMSIGKARVKYLPPSDLSVIGLYNLLKNNPHDALYLNSFFNIKFTIIPLFLRLIYLYNPKKIIIAPRGELSYGALGIKRIKKKCYLFLTKIIGLYNELIWQASSELEAAEIIKIIGLSGRVMVAPDLILRDHNLSLAQTTNFREPGPLRIIFISRISVKKNLDFLLKVLQKVKSRLNLSIYGPIEDGEYWARCLGIISELPDNIFVKYHGLASPDQVGGIFSGHDVFIFPTKGENFGHVIFESLSAGTPVIISDQTPWKPDNSQAITVLPLENSNCWVNLLEIWANYSANELNCKKLEAVNYAEIYRSDNEPIERNRKLFLS